MSDYENEDGEYYEEEGEVEEGQALGYDDEEGEERPEGEEVEEPQPEAPKEPEEVPLPPKKEWSGFVTIKLPSSVTVPNAPLKESRVYFADNEVPLWTRYLLNDDVPYFEAVLSGRDVSDPVPEGEEEAEEGEEGAAEEDEEGEDGEQNDEENEEDEDDEEGYGNNRRSRNSSKHRGSKHSKKSSRMSNQRGGGGDDDLLLGGDEPLPVEFDDDGFLVIPDPFKGSARFLFTQIFASQEADEDAGLPAIEVDEEVNCFIATLIPKEDADAEDAAFAEANGIIEGDEVPTVGPVTAPNLRALIMTIPPEPEVDEEAEEGEEGNDDEGRSTRNNNGGDDDEEQSGQQHDGEDGEGTARGHANDGADGEEDGGAPALEFRMDALTLSALFCATGFRRALLRKDLPPTYYLEGWLEVFALPAEGTTDQSTAELSAMLNHICVASTEVIDKKKKPDPLPDTKFDEDGNELPPIVDAKHPPPPPTFVSLNEAGLITVPKLTMDLRWTFALESERPELTAAMRYIRSRLLGTARVAPSYPSTALLKTPLLVQSFLEFLMVAPRSSLVSWTRPKPEEDEDEIDDLENILVAADDDQQRLTPLSYMLGTILLDLRTREARRKAKKRDMRLSAFAAHKAALCRRFLERATLYDPLLVPSYCPKAEDGTNANPLNATLLKTNTYSPTASSSAAAAADGGADNSPASPSSAAGAAAASSAPWPIALRLYDSDLVALACARYGALDTFREVLSLKNALPRAVDDTVGTYHLLFHAFEHLDRACAVCLVDFSAVEVKSIPLLTRRSIVPATECIDDVFAPIDKDDEYPSVFAHRYWQQLSGDKAWREAARARCPSLYMRVQDEEVRMQALIDAITKEKASGEYVLGQCKVGGGGGGGSPTAPPTSSSSSSSGAMNPRDVISPATMYHAVMARNVDVIVALSLKGVATVKKPLHSEQPLIDALLDDDLRRREERSVTPVAARTSEDLLATEDDVADGILSILLALVEAGQSLEGVIASGRRSVAADLLDRYGKCRKYKQLMKLWATREHERNTDPNQKFGLLRYMPSPADVNTSGSPIRVRQ